MEEVRPLCISCLCRNTAMRARPRPLSSSGRPSLPVLSTATSVDLPASTLPATAMRRSVWHASCKRAGGGTWDGAAAAQQHAAGHGSGCACTLLTLVGLDQGCSPLPVHLPKAHRYLAPCHPHGFGSVWAGIYNPTPPPRPRSAPQPPSAPAAPPRPPAPCCAPPAAAPRGGPMRPAGSAPG